MNGRAPRSGRAEHLWILALAAVALIGSFMLQPSDEGGLWLHIPVIRAMVPVPETCMTRRILGISCPGCGLTRSFVHLARGDVFTALTLNPMGPVLFLMCLLQIPYRVVEYLGLWTTSPLWTHFKQGLVPVTWVIAIGLIANWALRLL